MHRPASTPGQSSSLQTLQSAYEAIRTSYVERVPPDSLSAAAVTGMTETLDPFSVYLSSSRMTQVRESFRGSFEGIGISYELIPGPGGQDTIGVVSVVPGGPSAEAGLRAGDRIVEVADTTAVGWSHSKIQKRLKGPRGSTITVTLRRPGTPDSIQATITRDTVPLETVQATYMLDRRTGYLRLGRFAQTTHEEVTSSLKSLREKGMERLVLDLRGNGGGLMSMAEKVSDEFLVEGQTIVTARSRHAEYDGGRVATEEGLFEEGPVIVLVDEHSASASEIVAGALQDHDRALIVGRHTFGKGLIQRQFNLGDGSVLRLTVARFYTPAGRLLQRSRERSRDSVVTGHSILRRDTSTVPDSLLFRTDAGRIVIGGGGIRPDRTVPPPTYTSFREAVEARGLLRSFARSWVDARSDSLRARWLDRREAFASAFSVPRSVYPAFVRHAASHGVGPAGMVDDTSTAVVPDAEVQQARPGIESAIAAYVGQRLFGQAMWRRMLNQTDAALDTARAGWPAAQERARQYPVRD
jgi:carboxyl-terminal processing protease